MGIEELLLHLAEKRGLEKGLKLSEKKKSHIFVENLIVKMGLSDEQAADLVEVPLDFVAKVRLSLERADKKGELPSNDQSLPAFRHED